MTADWYRIKHDGPQAPAETPVCLDPMLDTSAWEGRRSLPDVLPMVLPHPEERTRYIIDPLDISDVTGRALHTVLSYWLEVNCYWKYVLRNQRVSDAAYHTVLEYLERYEIESGLTELPPNQETDCWPRRYWSYWEHRYCISVRRNMRGAIQYPLLYDHQREFYLESMKRSQAVASRIVTKDRSKPNN